VRGKEQLCQPEQARAAAWQRAVTTRPSLGGSGHAGRFQPSSTLASPWLLSSLGTLPHPSSAWHPSAQPGRDTQPASCAQASPTGRVSRRHYPQRRLPAGGPTSLAAARCRSPRLACRTNTLHGAPRAQCQARRDLSFYFRAIVLGSSSPIYQRPQRALTPAPGRLPVMATGLLGAGCVSSAAAAAGSLASARALTERDSLSRQPGAAWAKS